MKAQAATLADVAADIARRRQIEAPVPKRELWKVRKERGERPAQTDEAYVRSQLRKLAAEQEAGTAELAGFHRSGSDFGVSNGGAKADALWRALMAGRRYSLGEPGDRRGLKPSRPPSLERASSS